MAGLSSIKGTSQHLQRTLKGVHMSTLEESMLHASQGVIKDLGAPLVTQMRIDGNVSEPLCFLDLACGTGIITDLVQERVSPAVLAKSSFRAGDASEAMISVAKKRMEMEGWVNTEVGIMDAKKLDLPSDSFTHVAIALALHMIPGPDDIVKDSMRLLKPGGIFGASTWAAVNSRQWFITDLDTAFASLPFATPPLAPVSMQIHDDGHWTDASWIEQHLRELGLEDVTVEEKPGTYRFKSAEDWMMTFESMMMWMMNAKWDEEAKQKMTAAEVKERVLQHLREKYNGEGWDVAWTTIVMTGSVPRVG